MLPAVTGGANWQGGSLDPETKILYIFSNTNISPLGLVAGRSGQERFRLDFRFGGAGGGRCGRGR